jgi:hypothetical protein
MVLEAFAALSLAANIIQFVDFSGKLFTKVRQVRRSRDGTTEEYADLKTATAGLNSLKDELSSSTATVSLALGVTGEEKELAILAKECTELADDFSKLLERLKGRGRTGKRGSFMHAIKIMLKEDEIKRAQSRLEQFQTRVTVCLLTILRYASTPPEMDWAMLTMSRNNQSKAIKMLVELSSHAQREETRAKDLLAWKASVMQTLDDIKSLSDDARNQSTNLSSKLNDVATTLSKWATTGNQLATEHRILKSLRFEAMNARHAQIQEAHSKTFEWAYTSRSATDRSCTQFKFAEWLRSGNGHYWIAGKAGSGKSTLVKFLYDDPRTLSELKHWSGQKKLVTACFFFWNAGTERQKSVEGLLQSLLYEILRKCPSLIPIATPKRWEEQSSYHSESAPWSHKEMKDTFRRIQERGIISTRFCFFIDGLDEYSGDHQDLISILQDLLTSHDIKLCVSSRPWNIFQDAFGQDAERRLYLEDLTKLDIEQYVRDKFESSSQFMSLKTTDDRYNELVDEVVRKADGVFLWVFLIVRSLLQGLVNCDRLSELQRRLRLLPSKLEDYFRHILSATDETYSERAAETFCIALEATRPLPLLIYSYLDEEDPDYGINGPIKALSYQEAVYRLRIMKRRLISRCNGLLEITVYDINSGPEQLDPLRKIIDDPIDSPFEANNLSMVSLFDSISVGFIHRTVRDFLITEEIQNMIKKRVPIDFQPPSTICQAYLAQVKALLTSSPNRCDWDIYHVMRITAQMIDYARTSDQKFQRPETRTLNELERTIFFLWPVWGGLLRTSIGHPDGVDENTFFLELTVAGRLHEYVSHRLRSSSTLDSRLTLNKLLAVALVPAVHREMDFRISSSMVRLLIDVFEEQRTDEWTKVELPALWAKFLGYVVWNQAVWIQTMWIQEVSEFSGQREELLKTIRILLDIGANPEEKYKKSVAWRHTLRKLQSSKHNTKEELEFIEQYRNIFLACDVGSDPSEAFSESTSSTDDSLS